MSTSRTDPSPALRASELDRFSAYRAGEGGRRDAADEILDLSNNEVMISPLPAVAEALRRIGTDVNLYPDPTAHTLRLRLAEHFGAGAEETLVGPGSAGVLQQLLLVLCGAGDEVLYAWPGFDAYPLLIAVSGARGVPVPLTASGDHDLPRLLEKVNSRTRAVILCSPHNPTGSRITRPALRRFLDGLPSHVVAVLDQAYTEFDAEEDQRDLTPIRDYGNVVLLRTFSKAHGLAGLRVGYAFASAEIVHRARKTVIPFSITRTGERAAVASLQQQEALTARIATIRRLRGALEDDLGAEGLVPTPSAGNFVWLPLGPSSERFAASALEAGVRVRAYADMGVRISVGTEQAHRRVLLAARRHRSG
ncbi:MULTISPECIES: aminotransferase class I/II-fold pyridoxal phosphate-dependent enzyme [unclassified Streptomyces]|uniref:aminotransferase class I/II-fold pyridoxal phosphate-dependent enzyme n=1 Tax=unclassified Streptomyces TaxID=2593676 RepID=UPI000BF580D5|nr:aminotransferase class I/II-fold pyridoxal phosphate-dependent enzyme [Streptomyces sp. Ru87]PGH47032.1 aminotransferase [Streptomyces sp. Ru87]